MKTPINDVSNTALWVATYRAIESERPDALFHDPLARVLAGSRGLEISSQMKWTHYTQWSVVIRTRIIDHYIEELLRETRDRPAIDAVINLGCGLDTRPYRLPLDGNFRWIEVDFAKIIDLKNDRLKDQLPKCKLERVAVDLSQSGARRELFARLGSEFKNALILTEGVIPYLSEADVAGLARDLRSESGFRHWLLDRFSARVMKTLKSSRRASQMRHAPFQFDPKHWPEFFAQTGWRQAQICYVGEEAMRLGRPPPHPWLMRLLLRLTPQQKRAQYLRNVAYVVLEPSELGAPSGGD